MANIPPTVAPALTPTLSTIGDPDGTRTVASIVVLLAAIGLALLLLAVWIFRTTRPDPELLAPLEAMGERSWRRGDPVWQRRRLDELRPRGARPLAPSSAPPEIDESFDSGPSASGFDDLRSSGGPPSGQVAAPDAGASADAADASEEGSGASDTVSTADPTFDSTPAGVVGPTLDELPGDGFDEEAIAAAREQLERELAESSRRESVDEELDVFRRDPQT